MTEIKISRNRRADRQTKFTWIISHSKFTWIHTKTEYFLNFFQRDWFIEFFSKGFLWFFSGCIQNLWKCSVSQILLRGRHREMHRKNLEDHSQISCASTPLLSVTCDTGRSNIRPATQDVLVPRPMLLAAETERAREWIFYRLTRSIPDDAENAR